MRTSNVLGNLLPSPTTVRLFSALREMGYTGHVSCEARWIEPREGSR